MPSASVGISFPSSHGDIASEEASVELDQDMDSIIEKRTDVDVDDEAVEGENDVVVVKAMVDPVADQSGKKSIVMPGQKTKKATSYVWNYFYPNQENNCLAVCSLCKATVSTLGPPRCYVTYSASIRSLWAKKLCPKRYQPVHCHLAAPFPLCHARDRNLLQQHLHQPHPQSLSIWKLLVLLLHPMS